MFEVSRKGKIKSWCPNIEYGAFMQAWSVADLPFMFKHVAIMPDAHQGYGMPIGGVAAFKNVVIPNAVGVDIGCGMLACKTNLTDITEDQLKDIMGEIRKRIPMGKGKHQKTACDPALMPYGELFEKSDLPIYKAQYDNARRQLGTLGGGNHFIEIQHDEEGFIWFMIHSGSRNLGHKIATHYNKIAKEINQRFHSSVPKKADLAFLPLDFDQGRIYTKEMTVAVMFAQLNRQLMGEYVKQAIYEVVGLVQFGYNIDVPHNYASLENHYGENVWVHRKGATRAYENEVGIIPGSQGTCSYIVKGLGNPESFKSCSHGAGRVMSRSKAKEELDFDEEIAKMGTVIHGMRSASDLDEAPGSYKDIDDVMKNQQDLVVTLHKLRPLAVLKG